MARGGYRPGAGRPKLTEAEKAERKARKAASAPKAKTAPAARRAGGSVNEPSAGVATNEVPTEAAADAASQDMTPLDYMLSVMRAPDADAARRDRMAIAAAPFMHPRKEPVGEGKREKAALDAKDAVSRGKFSAAPPPKLAAVGGKKI